MCARAEWRVSASALLCEPAEDSLLSFLSFSFCTGTLYIYNAAPYPFYVQHKRINSNNNNNKKHATEVMRTVKGGWPRSLPFAR
jgi:hypothetical protein